MFWLHFHAKAFTVIFLNSLRIISPRKRQCCYPNTETLMFFLKHKDANVFPETQKQSQKACSLRQRGNLGRQLDRPDDHVHYGLCLLRLALCEQDRLPVLPDPPLPRVDKSGGLFPALEM